MDVVTWITRSVCINDTCSILSNILVKLCSSRNGSLDDSLRYTEVETTEIRIVSTACAAVSEVGGTDLI